MANFNIYSSSAGSGKTFTLTKEYLKLILANNDANFFKQILAITFTNDAAQEMKERILHSLKAISEVESFDETSGSWVMYENVLKELNETQVKSNAPIFTKEIIQNHAAKAFKNIIADYSDFSVKTIDSFVNQLVNSFSEELDLPFNFETSLDGEMILREAAERLIEKAGLENQDEITENLRYFIDESIKNGIGWNSIANEISSFGKHLINDQFLEMTSQIHSLNSKDIRKISKQIAEFMAKFEKDVQELGEKACQLIENNGIKIDDFYYSSTGIGKYFENVRDNFIDKIFVSRYDNGLNNRQTETLLNDKWFGGKTTPQAKQNIDSIKQDLIDIHEQVKKLSEENRSKYQLFKLLKPNLKKLILLNELKTEFEQVLRDKGQVYIAEFNRKIIELLAKEPVEFIYEKIGNRYKHIMVDEFQDTSEIQFSNLLPLIENSLGENNFNLLVGDAKQAIYRWRGGKMELIVHLYQKNSKKQSHIGSGIYSNINPKSLDTNFRSSENIIDFNNSLFEFIKTQSEGEFSLMKDAYGTFEQKKPPHVKKGGEVSITFLEQSTSKKNTNDESEGVLGYDETSLNKILSLIQEAKAKNFAFKDIAILCRKNAKAAIIANHLNKNNIPLISRDSLLLNNLPIIRFLAAFLKFVDSPENTLVKSELLYLYYQVILQKTPVETDNLLINDAISNNNCEKMLVILSSKNEKPIDWADLLKSNIYELTEKTIKYFNLFELTNQKNYLFRFLDVVMDFGIRESNHLQDFLNHWDKKKFSGTMSVKSPSDQDAVTITTIHRSKGLEYPIVILPFADWEVSPNQYSEFWADLNHLNYSELSSKGIKLSTAPFKLKMGTNEIPKEKLIPETLADQYKREEEAIFIENINLLYVALTRPVEKLFIISSRKERNNADKPIKNISDIFIQYLESLNLYQSQEETFTLFEGDVQKSAPKKQASNPEILLENIVIDNKWNKLNLKRASAKIYGDNLLEKGVEKGNIVHTAFAKIYSKKDVDRAINEMLFEGIISPVEEEELRASINRVLNLPELSKLFEEGLIVHNERDILGKFIQTQRPDRVVIKDDTVYIIDYKTGKMNDLLHEKYLKQISGYGSLYKQMGYKHIQMMIVYLENNQIITQVA